VLESESKSQAGVGYYMEGGTRLVLHRRSWCLERKRRGASSLKRAKGRYEYYPSSQPGSEL